MLVEFARIGELTPGIVVVDPRTVTDEDDTLTFLPDAVAVAVRTSFVASVIAERVHVPNMLTVAVPMEEPFLYTVINVPAASPEVPVIDVWVLLYVPEITGASVVPLIAVTTVTSFEAADKPEEASIIALAVILFPATRVNPVAVHDVSAVALRTCLSTPLTYI